jgi:nitrate reductase gamma subunit
VTQGAADILAFAVLPYVAIVLFVAGTLERIARHSASFTSRSSQFLENRQHFWSMVPFHYGLLAVLTGHLIAFAMPQSILRWNAAPIRLYALEATGFAFALLAAGGLAAVIVRRSAVPSVRRFTTVADWLVLALLLLQVANGVAIAARFAWGSSWFAAVASPYLWSILKLRPDISVVAALPAEIKLHVIGAFILIGVCPFSRLVHVLAAPLPYLWRRPQVVRWYHARGA